MREMKERYVVIRRTSSAAGMPNRIIGATAIASKSAWLIEAEELKQSQASNFLTNKDVVCLAKELPMKLISPVALEECSSSSGNAWGINAIKADSSNFSGSGVSVAVLDTGLANNHPAFDGIKVTRKDFTGEGDDDGNGHGTHCAGIIFGRDINGGRIGVAPGVTDVYIGKVIGNKSTTTSLIYGIKWAADQAVDIISMSLGIDFADIQQYYIDLDYPLPIASSRAMAAYNENLKLFERISTYYGQPGVCSQSGTIMIAAAGNTSLRKSKKEYYCHTLSPANAESIIAVSAVQQTSNDFSIAPFSNVYANISAPGVGILSAYINGPNGSKILSGTSMAAAHVSGIAALWAQKLKGDCMLSRNNLVSKLIATAVNKSCIDYNYKDYGVGMVQAPQGE
ncbi:MAG: S8 family serine peptidase [Magnetococcus sp. THC-1_WYH]